MAASQLEIAKFDPSELTYAAERVGDWADSALVRATLLPLLDHTSAVVREGAIIGLSNHVDRIVRSRLLRLAVDDPNSAVRESAMLVATDLSAMENEIAAWHNSTGTGAGLHEWLGMTLAEYAVAVSSEYRT